MWLAGGVAEDERLDGPATRQVVRRTAAMLRPYRRLTVLALITIVGYVLTQLAGPYLVRVAIDDGVVARRESVIWFAVAGYAVVAALNYGLARRQIQAIGTLGEGFLRDLRIRLFAHLQRLGLGYHDAHPTGVIVSRLTSDVDSMQELVQQGLLMLVANVLLVGLALVVLAVASPLLALSCLACAPVLIWSSRRFKRRSNDAYLAVRDRIGAMLARLSESLNGVRVIQAYAREPVEIERFGRANDELLAAHMSAVRAQSWYLPTVEASGVATTAIAVGFGGWLVLHDRATVGTVAFFVLTLNQLFEPIQQLSQLFNVVQSAGAALHKLYELLDTEPEVIERLGAVALPPTGELVLSDVGFAYGNGEPVLAGVTLRVARGERLALVGPTGAGKSTVAKLVARLYDPVDGTVSFGGVDLRRGTLASIRQRIVLTPQEGFLFSGSLADNVRIGRPDATDAEVAAALNRLGLLERFTALENGLDTELRERGSRLSAGEKQLVSLARAALADPPVLILDEATSSLDPGTEVEVEGALERLSEGRTVIVIAHRLSSAVRADRVAVIDGGRLVELGTHDDLLAAGGRYTELYAAWLSGVGPSYGAETPPAERAAARPWRNCAP
jgi:ATP-binding cassette, subfamily B, bacterial